MQSQNEIANRQTICVVGTGPAGAAAARLFADAGCRVHVYEQRDCVAGHCHDEYDSHGVLVHRFGPHYFRTNNADLLRWLSRFTEWLPGRYYVRAQVNGKLVSMPISLATMADLKGIALTEQDFEAYLATQRQDIPHPKNAEEQCLAVVGRELYEALFIGYTIKQWGVHPTELPASITARIPLRFNWDERYVTEKYQVMPKAGYTAMISNMLDHDNIRVELNSPLDGQAIRSLRGSYDATIFTGPIDQLFEWTYGPLGYRSLRFEWKHYEADYVQPCVQINYPNDHDYTRTVEIKHVTGQSVRGTTVCREYPEKSGDAFYPLLTEENRKRYERYAELAAQEAVKDHPIFLVSRLAEFRYFNMDQVFLRALKVGNDVLKRWH